MMGVAPVCVRRTPVEDWRYHGHHAIVWRKRMALSVVGAGTGSSAAKGSAARQVAAGGIISCRSWTYWLYKIKEGGHQAVAAGGRLMFFTVIVRLAEPTGMRTVIVFMEEEPTG